MVTCYWWKFWI